MVLPIFAVLVKVTILPLPPYVVGAQLENFIRNAVTSYVKTGLIFINSSVLSGTWNFFDYLDWDGTYPHMSKNSFSLMTLTPSFCAFSNFEPASSPARTKSVLPLTLPLTLPPRDSIFAEASSRVIFGKVPVSTNVLPANGSAAAFFAETFSLAGLMPSSFIRRKIFLPFSPAKKSRTLWATTGPTFVTMPDSFSALLFDGAAKLDAINRTAISAISFLSFS